MMAWKGELRNTIEPAAVWCGGGLTVVIRRVVEAPGVSDENGWLQIAPTIDSGRLNICRKFVSMIAGTMHLGLPDDDPPFWTDPPKPWTQKRIWAGEDIGPRGLEKKTTTRTWKEDKV
jgi:hypothetical protein